MWSTYQPLPSTPLGEAAVDEWPGPARERFDDYDEAPSRTPAKQTPAEREQTFAELGTLQAELVAAAGGTPRPVDVPLGSAPPSAALLDLLGCEVDAARWEDDALQLWLPEGRVEVRARDGARAYATTSHLALSYRGRDASASLRAALDGLMARLERTRLSDLREAHP